MKPTPTLKRERESFVIDTNIFFNLEANTYFGKNTKEVIETLFQTMEPLVHEGVIEVFMPQSIVDELLGFFDGRPVANVTDLLSLVQIKTPDYGSMKIPATAFRKIIEDIRKRSLRGLTIAQEELVLCAKDMMEKKTAVVSKMDFEKKTGVHIKKLRERYRQATRFGFLDSTADLDVILLAKEIDAQVVSVDEGVLKWCREFGVKELPVSVLKKRLESLLKSLQA